jgi:uncharacterized membrane protein SpoIIM required for sporulation
MTRETFLQRHRDEWAELQALLDALERQSAGPEGLALLAQRYRSVCRHLALARQRAYGAEVTEALHRLALRGHRQLYGVRRGSLRALGALFARDFPRVVRAERRLVAAAALTLLLPALAVGLAIGSDAERIHRLLPAAEVRQLETMYDPDSPHFARERASDGDVEMMGFYVWNNVTIAFRTFAGGVLAGGGTLLVLVWNGVLLGAVAGYLHGIGYGRTFFPFVAGHAAFELTALVLVGAAGLKLGLAVVAPGRLRRGDALRRAAAAALPIVYGSALMLLIAAVVEAFWSPRTGVPIAVKLAVAAGLWGMVALWLGRGGRTREANP